MIYASFSNVIKTRNYNLFYDTMSIPRGVGAEKHRSPAESRTVRQFVLAVNTGRGGVFLNFNGDIAIVVDRYPMQHLRNRLARLYAELVDDGGGADDTESLRDTIYHRPVADLLNSKIFDAT